jgi:hypothetical protein
MFAQQDFFEKIYDGGINANNPKNPENSTRCCRDSNRVVLTPFALVLS